VAASVDNLPEVIYRPGFGWRILLDYLRGYQEKYPEHAHDYVGMAVVSR